MKRSTKGTHSAGLSRLKLVYFFFLILVILYCCFIFLTPKEKVLKLQPTVESKNRFFVDTPGCRIPALDPFHSSVAKFVDKGKPIRCSYPKPPVIEQSRDVFHPAIYFYSNRTKHYGSNIVCTYLPFRREAERKNSYVSKEIRIKTATVAITDEFIRVKCVAEIKKGHKRVVFEDLFAFIQPKKDVEKRCDAATKNSSVPEEQLSVLLLAIDSVSKSHYLRQMIDTHRYLKRHIPMVELHGYNKIGKNTFPVMLPFLTGLVESEVTDIYKKPVDRFPFVWKDYAKTGYRTLLSEDNANTAIFNYMKKGFDKQPTDYYWRPFKIALQDNKFMSGSPYGCIKGRPEGDAILNWTLDFFDRFPTEPLFALTLLSYYTHDYMNTLFRYDEPYLNFIKQMNEKNHLNRTIVFFFSDHGFRFGEVRNTYVGRMEGKLPFVFILLPQWFSDKHPEVAKNLVTNSQRLTTVLDFHAMLKDILNFSSNFDPAKNFTSRGHSVDLFRTVVSGNRTCAEAKIPIQMCACAWRTPLPVKDPNVTISAQKLLKAINERTKDFRKSCHELKLDFITQAGFQFVPMDNEMLSNSSNIQVTIQTKPGGGLYEGSIWHLVESNSYVVDSTIERVNRYGNQSDCIIDTIVKPFCFCRPLSKS